MSFDPKPHGKPILLVDFDGVIHSYKSGWQGEDVIPDPPVPGVFWWLDKALEYFEIHVYSSRSQTEAGRRAMIAYVAHNCVPYNLDGKLTFTAEKSRAFLTIDDRCICFDGDWYNPRMHPGALACFVPWYKRPT